MFLIDMRNSPWSQWWKRTWGRRATQTGEPCREEGVLSDFYPQLQTRQRVHYLFAHCFLPQWVHTQPEVLFQWAALERGKAHHGTTDLAHRLWNQMEETYGLVRVPRDGFEEPRLLRRRVRDLSAAWESVGGRTCLAIRMPRVDVSDWIEAPNRDMRLPLAVWIAVIQTGPQAVRYFILEQRGSPLERWPAIAATGGALYEWTDAGTHRSVAHDVEVADLGEWMRVVGAALGDSIS